MPLFIAHIADKTVLLDRWEGTFQLVTPDRVWELRTEKENMAEVMEAWVNMFSFIMKSMLPMAIKGQTLETEIGINTKSDFSSNEVQSQMREIKYEKEKALSSSRSINTQSFHNPRISRPNSERIGQGTESVYVPKLPVILVGSNEEDL